MEQGQHPNNKIDPKAGLTQSEWNVRYRSRERKKLVGILILVLFILLLAFFRFGKTIPWGAR